MTLSTKTLSSVRCALCVQVYAEEAHGAAIARAIAQRRALRPFATTTDLSSVIADVKLRLDRHRPGGGAGGARKRAHPATKCFQALRIAVNNELAAVEVHTAVAGVLACKKSMKHAR